MENLSGISGPDLFIYSILVRKSLKLIARAKKGRNFYPVSSAVSFQNFAFFYSYLRCCVTMKLKRFRSQSSLASYLDQSEMTNSNLKTHLSHIIFIKPLKNRYNFICDHFRKKFSQKLRQKIASKIRDKKCDTNGE